MQSQGDATLDFIMKEDVMIAQQEHVHQMVTVVLFAQQEHIH